MSFINLHTHSHASIKDGVSTPKQIAERAKLLGQTAIAITEHGSLASLLSMQSECRKLNVKLIAGYEMYESDKIEPIKYHHLTLLSKTDEGVINLIKINNLGVLGSNFKNRRGQYVPLVSVSEIKENSFGKDIICLTGCSSSPLMEFIFTDAKAAYKCQDIEECRKLLVTDWKPSVRKYIEGLIEAFSNVYVEIQYHGLPIQDLSRPLLREIAAEMSLKCVPTTDAHYAAESDKEIQQIIFSADPTKKNSKAYNHCWIKSEAEMLEYFTQEEINNTMEVADLCNGKLNGSTPIVPKTKNNINIRLECEKSKRWNLVPKDQIETYKERLKYELEVIYKYGLQDYLCVVLDVCNACDNLNIMRGVGRGSAGGSLVCWLTGIVGEQIDPIKHGLFFERFINAGRFFDGRFKLPDIDSDIDAERREEVIDYIRNQYGRDNVCGVSNFSELSPKSSLRCYARSIQNYDDIDYLSNISERFESLFDMMQDKIYNTLKPLQKEFIKNASRLDGIISNSSLHGCAVVIIEDLKSRIPLRRDNESGNIIADLNKDDVEKLGGVKIDILGLTQLTKIKYMLEAIEQGKDKKSDIKSEKVIIEEETVHNFEQIKLSDLKRTQNIPNPISGCHLRLRCGEEEPDLTGFYEELMSKFPDQENRTKELPIIKNSSGLEDDFLVEDTLPPIKPNKIIRVTAIVKGVTEHVGTPIEYGDAYEGQSTIEIWEESIKQKGFTVKRIEQPTKTKMESIFVNMEWEMPPMGITHTITKDGSTILIDTKIDTDFDLNKLYKIEVLNNKKPTGVMGIADYLIYFIEGEQTTFITFSCTKLREFLKEKTKYLKGNMSYQHFEIPESEMEEFIAAGGAKKGIL